MMPNFTVKTPEEELEELKKKHEELKNQKIKHQTNYDNNKQALDQSKKELKETYQTDDLEELKQLLNKKEESNQQAVENFKKHLDEIEDRLDEINSPEHQNENP